MGYPMNVSLKENYISGATFGAERAYPSGADKFAPAFDGYRIAQSFRFLCSVVMNCSVFFLSLFVFAMA